MKIFLDDLRDPYDRSWIIARDMDQFVDLVLKANEPITHTSFDHDLGETNSGLLKETGMDVAKWFVEYCLDNPEIGMRLQHVIVHSANPVGSRNITNYFELASAKNVINPDLNIERRPI